MAADPKMWEAFFDWCRKEIDERREELAPYEAGTMTVKRGYRSEMVDITRQRIDQIKREIASLERIIKDFEPYV